jgi:outer membrane receptor protein involved in Fe transport
MQGITVSGQSPARPQAGARAWLLAGAGAIAVLCTAGAAAAQTATAESAAGEGLEEIIVTAQRRAENIQDVSIAIQAITAEGLARSGINDVSRLELISPGVTFARYGADAKISLRGANSNNTFLDSSPSVGVFVDGVYRPRASQQTRAFFDVQRVEILKGPQGTLYGRNTLAGAVNLWTNVPDPDDFEAGFTASYARFNTFRSEAFINVPLTDRVAVRLAGLFERGDGHVENLAGPNLGNPDTVSFRASARYEAPGGGDVTVRLTNIRERGNQTGLFAQSAVCRRVTAEGLTDPYGPVTDCQNPRRGSALGTLVEGVTTVEQRSRPFDQLGRLQVLKDFVHEDKIDELNFTLDFNAPLSNRLTARGVFSYTDFKLDLGQDQDFSEVTHGIDLLRERVSSWTNELQLSYDDENRFKATVGAYASKDDIHFLSGTVRVTRDSSGARPIVPVPGYPGVTRPLLQGTPVVNPRIDVGDPLAVNAAGRPTRQGQSSNNFQYLDVTSLGLFGQASFELFQDFRLVGGLRYSRDEKSSVNYGGGQSTTTYEGPQFPLTYPRTIDVFSTNKSLAISRTRRNYDNFTWRAAAEFDVNDDMMLFATVSTGFLSGSLATDGSTTDDQTSINYEAGIKSRFLDNSLQVNASVYHTEYSNLITSFQRVNSSGAVDTISINGGGISSTGVDLVVDARPTDALRLSLGISYLDSKFDDYTVVPPYQLVNGVPAIPGVPRFVNLKGVRPQFAPEWTLSFVAAYDVDLGSSGRITPQLQFYYNDGYSAQTQLSYLDPAGTQGSYTKTDLRLSWTSADDRFGVEGFVENLEDKVVLQRVTYGGEGIEQAVFGYPRNYGVRLRARF